MKYHVSFDVDLKRNPYKGKYIAIEGIDGCGKNTQLDELEKYLKKIGKKYVVTSEPKSELIVGKIIRKALKEKVGIPPIALQYLYSADRVINHEKLVVPALEKGEVVLSHRSFWSAIPYGVFDKIMNVKNGKYDYNQKNQILIAQGILTMYHQFTVPDITFYLDISVDTAMKRLSSMKKVKEIYEKREILEKIKIGYDLLLKEFSKEFSIINGEQSVEEVTADIIKKLPFKNET